MRASIYNLLTLALAAPHVQAWWQPAVGTTWQIVLSQTINNTSENVQAFDFDLFDNTASTISSIHSNGKKAICYFSAGSYENWRPDKKEFKPADLGKPLDGWAGERWVNTNSENVRRIMMERMDLAVTKGCDAIDPDNIDVYDNGGGGFGLKKADAVNYVNFLASEGHQRGLAVGLKNGGGILSQVLSNVEFSVNEQCVQYNECNTFRPFINAGKPVFHIEYVKGTPSAAKINKTCSNKSSQGFSTLIKHMNLDYFTETCPSSSAPNRHATRATAPGTKKTPCASHGNANSRMTYWPLYLIPIVFLRLA